MDTASEAVSGTEDIHTGSRGICVIRLHAQRQAVSTNEEYNKLETHTTPSFTPGPIQLSSRTGDMLMTANQYLYLITLVYSFSSLT